MLPPERAGRAPALADRLARCLEGIERPDGELADLFAGYRARLAAMGAFDLAALVADAVALLRAEPGFLAELRARFPIVAIDELQDIDPLQFELLQLLGEGATVLGIGDPDQAIYGFRGADRSLFFRVRDEPGTVTFALPRTYRSTPEIVRAATAVLADRRSLPAAPIPVRPASGPVRWFAAMDPSAEAGFIATTIRRLVGGVDSVGVHALRGGGGGRSFADIAVLYRTRAVRDSLLPAFERAGLPFALREDAPVTAGEPWRTVASALRFLGNPADRVALAEILGRPARTLDRRTRQALASPDPVPGFLDRLAGSEEDPRLASAAAFAARLARDRDALVGRIVADGLEPVLEDLMDGLLPEANPDLRAGPEAEILRAAARETVGDLERFLRRLDLAPLESEAGMRTEKVRLLTFHAAKGLEFPVVFIAGAEEGIVPIVSTHVGSGDADPDEERRLFYVAMTRAMDELYVSYSRHRQVHGKDVNRMPSRYLSDIPGELCEEVDAAGAHGRKSPRDRYGAQLPLF